MRILFATPEALPYWKTGGLADVAHALPQTLVERGHDVRVILPYYRRIRESHPTVEDAGDSVVPWPGGNLTVRFLLHTPEQGAPEIFVEHAGFFDTAHPYGTAAEDPVFTGVRYAFFCRAVVEYARSWGADVVHLNDWQTGLVPVYGLLDGMPAATVFAIHNLHYQGNFPPAILDAIGIPQTFMRQENGLEFWGRASFMKGALALADQLVTVSPTYAAEIQTHEGGAGLDGLLRFRHRVLHGILNGIDLRMWDPRADAALPVPFDEKSIAGKETDRAAVLEELGLEDGGPLIGLISRMAHQKGIDLLLEALPRMLELGANLAVVGNNGDLAYEAALADAAAAHPGRIAFHLGFEDALARRLYAGADFFLMPSRYEPCGLGQMIAQRYGTVPVVRHTGGLVDTVQDGVTGFSFQDATPQALVHVLERASKAWRGRRWNTMRRRCMALDWSWDRSAAQYEEVYRLAMGTLRA